MIVKCSCAVQRGVGGLKRGAGMSGLHRGKHCFLIWKNEHRKQRLRVGSHVGVAHAIDTSLVTRMPTVHAGGCSVFFLKVLF